MHSHQLSRFLDATLFLADSSIEAIPSLMQVRSQDVVFGLSVSSEAREIAWTWLKVSPNIFILLRTRLNERELSKEAFIHYTRCLF